MFEKISKKLKAIIDANSKIQSVYTYEASDLAGTPACTITPSSNENSYTTTTENRRIYSFIIRLYVLRSSGSTNEDTAEKAMRDLVDTVLDAIDADHQMSGLETESGYMFLFANATPSKWGYAGREDMYRVAEIEVKLNFDVDTTVVS